MTEVTSRHQEASLISTTTKPEGAWKFAKKFNEINCSFIQFPYTSLFFSYSICHYIFTVRVSLQVRGAKYCHLI